MKKTRKAKGRIKQRHSTRVKGAAGTARVVEREGNIPVGFGKTDVVLTKDALLRELERVENDLLALSYRLDQQAERGEKGALDTGKAMSKGLRRLVALREECIRQGYLK